MVLPAFRPLEAVGVDVAELLLLLPPPPSLTDLPRPLGGRMLSPPPEAGFPSARPPKKPPSLPNPPLLGDLDLDLTSPVRGDLTGPGDSTGTRDLVPALGEEAAAAAVLPPPQALRIELVCERAGTVAPRDLAALEVLTRADGPAGERAGGTTAILPEAGDRATAAAAVAAAEGGTALHLRGTATADAAAPTAAAATAAAISSSPGRARLDAGDEEDDGDIDAPAMATSSPRVGGRPLCSAASSADAAVDADAVGVAAAAGLVALLEVPPPLLTPASAVAAGLRLLGEAFLETLLRRWAGLVAAPAALLLGEDLVAPGFPEAAASPSLAAFIASRSAALRASTRAAARSTAAFGVRFLESTVPLPPAPPAPPRGGGAEARWCPGAADEGRLSPLLLTARGPPPPPAVAAALGFVEAAAGAAVFLRPLVPVKPPLIQPLSRLNESFTWYLPLRGEEARGEEAPPPAAIERRSETPLSRPRMPPRPPVLGDLLAPLAAAAAAAVARGPDRASAASDSSSAGSIAPTASDSGSSPAETERRCPRDAATAAADLGGVSPVAAGIPERGGAPSACSCICFGGGMGGW